MNRHGLAGPVPDMRPLRVKFILPALTEATSPYWRPIKYSLFPPLGLATLAAYLAPDDEAVLEDEHVAPLRIGGPSRPGRHSGLHHQRASRLRARGSLSRARRVRRRWAACTSRRCPTRRPRTPTRSSSGPGEQTFPRFLADFRARPSRAPLRVDVGPHARSGAAHPPRSHRPAQVSGPQLDRRHPRLPAALRLLLQGRVLRGRPVVLHPAGGRRARGDRPAARPASVLSRRPSAWRIRDSPRRCSTGMRGMNRLFQGAATVDSILRGDLIERAAAAGLRSIFVGFETLDARQPRAQQQAPEPRPRLRRGHQPPARARHHDQRQLRLRHG